mgnify:CR=1 FL=1
MKPITFHEQARQELQSAVQYYEDAAPGLGKLFLHSVEQSLDKIVTHPLAFQRVDTAIHHKNLYRFPYRIVYVVESTRLRVLAIAHHKRKPGYWNYRT